MAETDDPVAALGARELPIRAAAARDLAVMGSAVHLELLVRRSIDDPSPGVRLGCAAAAADILSRHRLGDATATVPPDMRESLLKAVSGADPSHNVGLFQVCGALGTPASLQRILIGLRDPRSDVRAGATVGLMRYAASAASPPGLEQQVVPLLRNERIRPETQAEIARLCGMLGFWTAIDGAQRLAESPAKGVAQVAGEALSRLSCRPGLDGLWIDLGVDAGEVRPGAKPTAMVATVGQRVFRVELGGPVHVRVSARPEQARQLLLRRPGSREPATEVLQLDGGTLWAQDADEQVEFGDLLIRANAFDAIRAIDPILPATASTFRLRGAVALHAGNPTDALIALEAATEMKRCPLDTWYFYGVAMASAGRKQDAGAAFERYIAKAAKKAQFLQLAKEALGGLGLGA